MPKMQQKSLDYFRKWRSEHPEAVKAAGLAFYRNHPDRSLFRNARVRAKDRGVPFTIVLSDIGKVPSVCPCCSGPIVVGNSKVGNTSPTLDQLIPGNGYTPQNIWIICHGCNRKKGDMTVAFMLEMADLVTKEIARRCAS